MFATVYAAIHALARRAICKQWRAGLFGASLLMLVPAGIAGADEAARLCGGGAPGSVSPGTSGQIVIEPGADMRLTIDQPLGAGRVDLGFDSFLASPGELTSSSRKIGVLLVTCRSSDPRQGDDTEVLRVVELEPGISARNFVPIIATDRVREGDFYSLRAIAIPRQEEERSRLRRALRGAAVAGTLIWGGGGSAALIALSAADLLSSAADSGGDLPFGLEFTISPENMAAPEQPTVDDDPAVAEALPPAAGGDDILLQDWAAGLVGPDTPQLMPFLPGMLPTAPEITPQLDPSGHLAAPTRAVVGSRVPVLLSGTQGNDWLILVSPDEPDDAMTDRYNRRRYAVGDAESRYRIAAGFPGRQELRLHRPGESIIARHGIELVDIDIELLGPSEVMAGSRFDVFLNPVMDGHLIITEPERDPEEVVDRYNRMRYGISASEGAGVFSRTAPREAGEYELRFYFNPRYSDGRMMARFPFRVTEGEVPPVADDDLLQELATQIAALEERIEDVTLAQVQSLRARIEALGLPALALLVDLAESGGLGELLALALLHAPAEMLVPAAQAQPAAADSPTPAPAVQLASASPRTAGDGPGATPYQVAGVAADDVLNVRAGPGAENVIVGLLAPDASGIQPTGEVARSDDGGTWWQIADSAFPGGLGWVNARFLEPEVAASTQPASTAPASGAQTYRVTGIDSNAVLYLRDRPSRQGTIVGMLAPHADTVESTGERRRTRGIYWVEIIEPNAPFGTGWALAEHLEPVGSDAAAPDPATDDGPTLTGVVESFAQAPGYHEIDTQGLENAIWQLLPHAPDTAMAPGAALSPLVKALLAVQAHDGALPHARYHLRYAQTEVTTQPGRPTALLSLIELRRFNLGPARHRQLQDIHGPENVAPAAEFGEGPHVGWRIITRGLRGTQALIVVAARREIDTPEADCMGFHCLMGQGINEHLTDWEMQPSEPAPDFSPSYEAGFRGGPSSAAALDMLALHNRLAEPDGSGDARWNPFEWRESVAPGEPFIDVIIEIGLGQDAGVDVMLRDSELMDTSLETMWYRLVAIGEGQGALIIPGHAAEHRPGHQ